MSKNELISMLCWRLANFSKDVSEIDYPRIEELNFLLKTVLEK